MNYRIEETESKETELEIESLETFVDDFLYARLSI